MKHLPDLMLRIGQVKEMTGHDYVTIRKMVDPKTYGKSIYGRLKGTSTGKGKHMVWKISLQSVIKYLEKKSG
jgi:hypothetical protein